jgi:epoxyqueuosine reductase
MLNSKMVKEYARECGADLVGIGSMDRFDGAPMQRDPRYIMPKAKSIIGLAFRVHRGILRGLEEGTYWGGYSLMGYANINDVYAPVVIRKVSSLLEDYGYETLPYHNNSVRYGIGQGKPVAENKPKPDVFLHFRIAGVICGLGEIGQSNLFLTPEFGPAQRLVFILTEAELEPDPVFSGKLCDKCMLCVKNCPAKAISSSNENQVKIGDKEMTWGRLDEYKCSAVMQSGTRETSPFISEEVAHVVEGIVNGSNDHVNGTINFDQGGDTIWEYLKNNVPFIKAGTDSFHHAGTICGARGCMRACLDHLDKKGVLTRKFKHPYREEKTWTLKPEPEKK